MAFRLCVRCIRQAGGKVKSEPGHVVEERGLYFPIKHRIVDHRVHPAVAEQADVQSRYRRELRSHIITGETRQVKPARWSGLQCPTHFLALPLPPQCGLRVLARKMRESIIFSHPNVEPLLIPDAKLHLTLGVFTLPSPSLALRDSQGKMAMPLFPQQEGRKSEVQLSSTTLLSEETLIQTIKLGMEDILRRKLGSGGLECRSNGGPRGSTAKHAGNQHFLSSNSSANNAKKRSEGLHLRFSGMGTFSQGRVLFARCLAEKDFRKLDDIVRAVRHYLCCRLGVDVKGNPYDGFVPHVTLGKIRKHQEGIVGNTFPPSFWADYQFSDFGDIHFNRIDLCLMRGKSPNFEESERIVTVSEDGTASNEDGGVTHPSFRNSKDYYPVCFSLPLR